MQDRLKQERDRFIREKRDRDRNPRQYAMALSLLKISFNHAAGTEGINRTKLLRRIDRLVERERLRGFNRHWSYDLNRHIALKQLRDCLS